VVRKGRHPDRNEHIPSRTHPSFRAGGDPWRLLGRRTITDPAAKQGGSSASQRRDGAQRDAALSTDESINVRIYRQASAAVANILTKATEYDFFMDPVPVEGAGSDWSSIPAATILTNFHVVQEAPIHRSRTGDHPVRAKFIGADQRNDGRLDSR